MILTGIALGLVLGLLAGGRISNLGSVQLRWVPLLVVALILRFGTELLLTNGALIVDTLRVPLLATSFGLLLAGIWVNRTYPGMTLAFVGTLSNGLVILVNGGYMPIWEPSLIAAGFTAADVSPAINTILPATLDASFLVHLGPLADVIPIPFPIIQNVASIGDRMRFGSVATTKASAPAVKDSVTPKTIATSATVLMRSPKIEMSWPAQSAEKEPLRASRTYG